MKKILTVLCGLLFLQNAYCDSLDEFSEEIQAFMNDKMDEAALRALCEKLVVFAHMRNINVLAESASGKYINVTASKCKEAAIKNVPVFIMLAAEQISEHTTKQHSQCAQNLMQAEAMKNCEGITSTTIQWYQQQGFTFNFNPDKTIVDCSKTDNRCVVNRPASKAGANYYFSVCCSIPVLSCNEEQNTQDNGFSHKEFNGVTGDISVLSEDIVGNARTLNDFDYACKPINK